ncbi:MAG: DUF177 domain-containing protein [Pseudomonadota bacterium]
MAKPSETAVRVAGLPQSGETPFSCVPTPDALEEIARALDLIAVRKLRFEGTIAPLGASDWQLAGRLGATVVQNCVVSTVPVTTRIDMPVHRQFLANYREPTDLETEMTDDDTVEALSDWIDPAVVMQEALSIAVPDYPRAEGATLGQMVYAARGTPAMTDADAKPFAGLADLKAKLEGDEN